MAIIPFTDFPPTTITGLIDPHPGAVTCRISTLRKLNGRSFSVEGFVEGFPTERLSNTFDKNAQPGRSTARPSLVAGGPIERSIELKWFAAQNNENLDQILGYVRSFVAEWDRNGRAPVPVVVTWGTESFRARVESVEITKGPRFRATKLLVWFGVKFQFADYNPIVVDKTNPTTQKAKETTWVKLRGGQSPEAVAQELFNNPLRGITIRQINPEIYEPSAGDVLRVFDSNHPLMIADVKPLSPALTDPEFASLVVQIATQRLQIRNTWAGALAYLAREIDGFAAAVVDAEQRLNVQPSQVSPLLFRLPERWRTGTTRAHVYGLRQELGVDYTESVDQRLIVFASAPGVVPIIHYETEADVASGFSFNVPFTGAINGINTVYTFGVQYSQVAATMNGVLMEQGVDYNAISSTQVQYATAPPAGSVLIFDVEEA